MKTKHIIELRGDWENCTPLWRNFVNHCKDSTGRLNNLETINTWIKPYNAEVVLCSDVESFPANIVFDTLEDATTFILKFS